MMDFIKKFIPEKYKRNPAGLYNRMRKTFGFTRHRYNLLKRQIEQNPEICALFPADEMSRHYVYEVMRQSVEFPALYVNQVRYYRLYEFFRSNYPDMFEARTSIINVGDTSGILLHAMGKRGLSVNISKKAVDFIKQKGMDAELQNAEALKYPDRSFDYAFCFQCLEHIKNPIAALNELGRVAKKKVFISIPYVTRTIIGSRKDTVAIKALPVDKGGYGAKNIQDNDCHIFEFSTEDLRAALSFTGLRYVDNFPINYFMPIGSTRKNCSSFFNFFILGPMETTSGEGTSSCAE